MLLFHCSLFPSLFVFVLSLFCCAVCLYFLALQSSRSRKRDMVGFFDRCHVAFDVLWLFLTLTWASLQCVIVAFQWQIQRASRVSARTPAPSF